MPYLVLARKWRPQTFDEVIGQPHVIQVLQNSVESRRVAHAYLFTGSRGVGKTSVARILAKSLNCEKGISVLPCNECSNCREVTQGNSMDVIEIDGASNRGIDNIRELRETVRYRPGKSRFKVFIIDEVHMLTTEAFNALLKTLEEPPEHVLFLMATTEPHRIPATILSRCQRFDFRRIPVDLIVKHLKTIVRQENAALSDSVLYAIAQEADGSMRDAQSLLEQLLAFSGEDLRDEEVLDILGVVDRRSIHRLGEAILDGDLPTCLQVAEDLYRRGIDSRRACQQLCEHFRNLLLFSLAEAQGTVQPDVPQEEKRILREEVCKTSRESLYLYFQMLLKGEEEIRRSSLPRMALEMLLVRLAQLPRLSSLDQLIAKIAQLEGMLASGASPPSTSRGHGVASPLEQAGAAPPISSEPVSPLKISSPPQAADPPVCAGSPRPPSPEEVIGRWPSFLLWLKDKDPVLEAKLQNSRVRANQDGSLTLEVLDIFREQVARPDALKSLSEATLTFFFQHFQWKVEARSAVSVDSPDTLRSRKPRSTPTRLVLENPIVQQAIEILGGELLDIKRIQTDSAKRAERDAASAFPDGGSLGNDSPGVPEEAIRWR
ncbi:MAG: DNA polymerase III subunit gamma/tau [Syntrophobacteraceae bacterium]|nr:DNA polymerase III subunit gamma/tau [Syntrophobacteraceae bacterium]